MGKLADRSNEIRRLSSDKPQSSSKSTIKTFAPFRIKLDIVGDHHGLYYEFPLTFVMQMFGVWK